MTSKVTRGLVLSTLLVSAAPVLAEEMVPATLGATTMGSAMVDAKGMALYTFDQDVGGKSMCNGECAVEWPPLPAATDAVASGDWSIVVRDDGSRMWAFKGEPLYTFVDDKAPGEVTGDNEDGFHLAAVTGGGTVAVASLGTTTMGQVVDSHGMALYTFDQDADGKSMCNGECAVEWPPLKVADGSVAAGDCSIVIRDDGSQMWALNGHPLYTFVNDKAPGEVAGDNEDGFHLAH